jgi:hypothetical protein
MKTEMGMAGTSRFKAAAMAPRSAPALSVLAATRASTTG